MTHPIRYLAGLPFRVLSPSLYACMVERGTIALRYNGRKWELVTFNVDSPEQVTTYPTLQAAATILNEAIEVLKAQP